MSFSMPRRNSIVYMPSSDRNSMWFCYATATGSRFAMTSEDSDRALIVETLEQVSWVVGGPRGGAAKLGLKRTTLLAKMRRLGISRPISQEGTDWVGVE
jgi:transcriptional regulator with GAF, ATPase, and Fis domain